jgi:hypothetical protein
MENSSSAISAREIVGISLWKEGGTGTGGDAGGDHSQSRQQYTYRLARNATFFTLLHHHIQSEHAHSANAHITVETRLFTKISSKFTIDFLLLQHCMAMPMPQQPSLKNARNTKSSPA